MSTTPSGSLAHPRLSPPAGPAQPLHAPAPSIADTCRATRPDSPRGMRVREMLDRVGDKWSLSVVAHLGERTKRFSELQREGNGISHRVLTATLRTLERDGMVTRTVYPVVPPRVDYTLTELGVSLLAAVEPLVEWAAGHAEDIDEARDAFDGNRG